MDQWIDVVAINLPHHCGYKHKNQNESSKYYINQSQKRKTYHALIVLNGVPLKVIITGQSIIFIFLSPSNLHLVE